MYAWDKLPDKLRCRQLETMNKYIEVNADPDGVRYWKEKTAGIKPDDLIDTLVYTSVLYWFYIALTTDFAWMREIGKAFIKGGKE